LACFTEGIFHSCVMTCVCCDSTVLMSRSMSEYLPSGRSSTIRRRNWCRKAMSPRVVSGPGEGSRPGEGLPARARVDRGDVAETVPGLSQGGKYMG
jgi:hypothetical protein